MKKMKFLISQLYLLALFALPFVSTSCSDDDDNSTKVEISSLGVEDGTTIVTGQIIQLEAQLSNPQGEVHYSWSTAGKEVSTQSTYTFQSDVTGTHTITLTVTANNEAQEKSINIIVVKPPFYVINEGQGKGSVNRYKHEESGIKPYFEDFFISKKIGYHKPDKKFFDYCFAHIPDFKLEESVR